MWFLHSWHDYDNVYCDQKLQKGDKQAVASSTTRESLSMYWLQTNLASIQKYKGTIQRHSNHAASKNNNHAIWSMLQCDLNQK